MVSSLIPKTAPNRLKNSIITVKMILPAPNFDTILLWPILSVNLSSSFMATSIDLLSFIIQKAPPIISMKTMISALSTNPSKRAENTCHVWGLLPVYPNDPGITTSLSTPLTVTDSLANSPPGMIHVRIAQNTTILKTIT